MARSITFRLNPKAKWHDGKTVTAEDVVYSMDSMVDARQAHLAWSPRRKIQGISSTLARRSEFSVGWAVPIKEDEIGVPSF
jgi:ABC-type transport system substrate-binding protein